MMPWWRQSGRIWRGVQRCVQRCVQRGVQRGVQSVHREGVTLIELMMGMAVASILFTILMQIQSGGLQSIASNDRKLGTLMRTHIVGEMFRHDFLRARLAVVVPLADIKSGQTPVIDAPLPDWLANDPEGETASQPPGVPTTDGPGSPLGYISEGSKEKRTREYYFDASEKNLYIDGVPRPLDDARFLWEGEHLVKFILRADESQSAGHTPKLREKTTLVSAVFPQVHAEEVTYSHHSWEDEHTWCILGPAVHLGFTDP